jgi:iron-sulfur cluster assembly accessory protein
MEETESPITLTDKAAEAVQKIRAAEKVDAAKALRLGIRGGGCNGFSFEMTFDEPKPGDRRFSLKGVEVVVDEMSLMYLVGSEIDYLDGLNGSGFKLNNPNVKSTCGCGSSFSV